VRSRFRPRLLPASNRPRRGMGTTGSAVNRSSIDLPLRHARCRRWGRSRCRTSTGTGYTLRTRTCGTAADRSVSEFDSDRAAVVRGDAGIRSCDATWSYIFETRNRHSPCCSDRRTQESAGSSVLLGAISPKEEATQMMLPAAAAHICGCVNSLLRRMRGRGELPRPRLTPSQG
jgi:hypothetical protein